MMAKSGDHPQGTAEQQFRDRCTAYLHEHWSTVTTVFERAAPDSPQDPLGPVNDLIPLIHTCQTAITKTYHYVLPTQLLAKCVDPALDCHRLQAGSGVPGAFDARSLAHVVIVPFDQANYRVLGGSEEPYVSKPLRIPAVTPAYRDAQKRKGEWDALVTVLDAVEQTGDERFTKQVFRQVLFEVYRLLAAAHVVYATPNRISLDGTHRLVAQFLAGKSGGDRLEAVATALFQIIGERFHLFSAVRREKVNAADSSSGMVADIECSVDGRVVLLVEVKDRSLTLIQLDAKLDAARSRHISEILFLAQQEKEAGESGQIDERIAAEFTSGQNIYVSNLNDFALGILILLGEDGRVDFLGRVGAELDRANSAIQHRRAWAGLLRQV